MPWSSADISIWLIALVLAIAVLVIVVVVLLLFLRRLVLAP